MSTQPSQNPSYPQSTSPAPEAGHNQNGQQAQQSAYPQQNAYPQQSAYPQQGYAPQPAGYYPPPPPPGTFVGTTIHPSNQSWVRSGTSVAGVVIAGRCLIGCVSSGIFFIVAAVIMYMRSSSFDFTFNNGHIYYYTNPVRIVAHVFLGIGILFLVGGVAGIIIAYRAVQKSRAEGATATTATIISPAPVLSGQNQTLYGQQNQAYVGAAGGFGAPPSNAAPGLADYNQPGFEKPPPYDTQEKPNSPEAKY